MENLHKYAIVKDGVVINVIVWDGDDSIWQPPADTQAVNVDSLAINIGDSYEGVK